MKCDCPDWKPNIEILDGMIVTQTHMAWGNKNGYTGKPFVYCPWCCKKLMDENSVKPHWFMNWVFPIAIIAAIAATSFGIGFFFLGKKEKVEPVKTNTVLNAVAANILDAGAIVCVAGYVGDKLLVDKANPTGNYITVGVVMEDAQKGSNVVVLLPERNK